MTDETLARAEAALMDDLFSERGRDDPHAVLREHDLPGCRYAFVHDALHDPRFVAPQVPDSPDLLVQVLQRFMIRLPPDRHAVMRRCFGGLFTPRRVERFRTRISSETAALLEALASAGPPADFIDSMAKPLPFTIIADVLGVPAEGRAALGAALDELGRGFAGQRDRRLIERGNSAAATLLGIFDDLLQQRRVQPREDLLSLLAAQPLEPELQQDLLANCIFFVMAGHNTTTVMLCEAVRLLSTAPDQLARLQADPVGWPAAVEEVLRFVSPVVLTGVTATRDAAVAGVSVQAGERRTVVYAAANRDPAVFDEPDTFTCSRTPNPHLAFSAGASFCLGAPLARMHGQVVLPAVFTRLPALRPAAPTHWRGSAPVRQIEHMPVRW